MGREGNGHASRGACCGFRTGSQRRAEEKIIPGNVLRGAMNGGKGQMGTPPRDPAKSACSRYLRVGTSAGGCVGSVK